MRLLPLLVVVVGCASASLEGRVDPDGGNNLGGADSSKIDAAPLLIDAPSVLIDAPAALIDAPVGVVPVTLIQNGATTVTPTQIGCQQNNPLTGFTTENSYYRTFPLSDFNITTPLTITSVTFGVERATAGNAAPSQTVEVRLGTYTGTVGAQSFGLNQITQQAVAIIQVPNNVTSVTTPISAFAPSTLTIPAGAVLYAEVFVPDGRPNGNTFYLGSNQGTETRPSYIRATDCTLPNPTQYALAVPSPNPVIRILLTVNGTH